MKDRNGERKIEILAPAGNLESVYAAVRCGADAVYVGGNSFSARAGAENFTPSQLEEAVGYCHLHNVKLYQALNTLIFDSELEEFLRAAKLSAEIGTDAFIVQDLGAAAMLKQALPDMKLNASTQMSIHTRQGALFAKEAGFSRVVLSRELSLPQIAEICSAGIETEVFIHGALCMSVSGQCYMSAVIGSRSANRGFCAQACRLPFSAVEGESRFDLSLKDMSCINYIDELRGAGVCSLKIEGRMKRAEYVAAAVSAARAAADGSTPDTERLRAVFSRSGFTDGYLTGKTGAEMFGTRRREDVVSAEAVLPGLRELYRKETKTVSADFHAVIKRGEPSELRMTADNISVTVRGDIPGEAVNHPLTPDALEKQLSRLGGTPYSLGKVTSETEDGLILTAAQLNGLRRTAVEKMDAARISAKRHKHTVNEADLNFFKTLNIKAAGLRVRLERASQLPGVTEETELIILPLEEILKRPAECGAFKDRLCAALPRFTADEAASEEKIVRLKAAGINKILCTNAAHIRIGKIHGMEMHGDFGLNVTNSLTLRALAEAGLTDATASFELKLSQINRLGDFLPYGIIAYGRLPLMLTRNCPIKQAVGSCKSCTGGLTDRTGRRFPVRCDGVSCEILNSDLLVMSDKLDELDVSFIRLDFHEETAEEVRRISECFISGRKIDVRSPTRGLYYRGII